MKQRTLIASFALAAAFSPVFASAGTVNDIQNQIQSLLTQVRTLQEQLRALTASSTPPRPEWREPATGTQTGTTTRPIAPAIGRFCLNLGRNLSVGSKGEDVRQLQSFLAAHPESGFMGTSTGVFGPLTANAVARFQARLGISTSTDGTIGQRTRNFLLSGCEGAPDMFREGDERRASSTPPRLEGDHERDFRATTSRPAFLERATSSTDRKVPPPPPRAPLPRINN